MQTHRLALPRGFKLENYELTDILGKGGFGITYLGMDQNLGRKVAVKELMPDTIVTRGEGLTVVAQSEGLASNWEWAKERFLEEACMLAGFQHENIVHVHQIIEANGTVYMVMDYIEGESYEARLRRIGREPDEASMRAFLEPLMDGLEEVHRAGLLHRDIKPDNILLRRGSQPILLDFGSARKQVEGTAVMTSIVTHGYSPIEQYQLKGKQGPWTDIYALGAVAVRAITGEKPPVSADRISEDEFIWLSYRALKGFSPRFLRAIDWAMRVKPKERASNIVEWRESFGWRSKNADLPAREPVPSPVPTGPRKAAPQPAPAKAAYHPPKAAAPPVRPRPPATDLAGRPKRGPDSTLVAGPARPNPTVRNLPTPQKNRKLPILAAVGVLAVCVLAGGLYVSKKWHSPAPAKADASTTTAHNSAPAAPASGATPGSSSDSSNSKPYRNSLGMEFLPIQDTNVLFSVWDTRVRDYEFFARDTGRSVPKPNFKQTPDHPVVNVSWEDARAFCEWLSAKERQRYRLPTDAEWSTAVGLPPENGATPREKDSQIKDYYPWGPAWPPPIGTANYAASLKMDTYENTSPVDAFPRNRYGLRDMSGNVWQWCEDAFDSNSKKCVLRGGAWNIDSPEILLSSFRFSARPKERADTIGFRCVLEGKK